MNTGNEMYTWAKELFPLNRSLSGDGVRETLDYLKKIIPELKVHKVASGTKAFDWTVPNEWNVKEAWIKDENGNIIIDFANNNLHLLGYSTPVSKKMSLSELQQYLYSLPDQPNAIPYVTSYYKERWGFCISDQQRKKLSEQTYEVFIDSELKPGFLNLGEVVIPGEGDKEILISTYICHPSMANNELSGPIVATAVANWLKGLKNRRYTYRILFLVETIGSLVYLSKHLTQMKEKTKAGFVLTCIGDSNNYSMLESRYGNTLADKIAKHVLKFHTDSFTEYSFLERGSDERQFCAPGIDLPVCVLMRSKFDEYPEYHTSLDNLDFISPEGLFGGFEIVKKSIEILENDYIYKVKILGEPQLGKHGLYPTTSSKDVFQKVKKLINLIAYADGTNSLLDIAILIEENFFDLHLIAKKLVEKEIFEKIN